MIHQYQNNGYNIVLDVNSGAVHVVDQEAYDVIAVLNEMNAEHTPETLKAPETETVLKEKLGDRYTEEDLKDILDAVTELTEQGRLFTKDIYENLIGIVKQRKTGSDAMAESKSRLLHILKYLWQNTDAGHYTTTADILTYLKTDIPASWEDRMKIWQTFLFVI